MQATVVSATRNRFAVLDGFDELPSGDFAELARRTCATSPHALDGLILLLPPREHGDCRMVVFNADGSRPEACGNGLRCIAKLAVERGHARDDVVWIETDGGYRRVEVRREDEVVRYAWAEMGVPLVVARNELLTTTRGSIPADLIDMGNPHCVLFVDDVDTAPVEELGPELERHARFPNRTNVEFAAADGDGLAVRIWERGVGETASCGTGVSAAAAAAILRARGTSPLEVRTRGGRLQVEWDGEGTLRLGGTVQDLEGEIQLEEGG